MDNKKWFKEAQFGMMVHFGLYSLLGGEWKGRRMPFIGEWAQSYFRIPNQEYGRLAAAFNPVYFNAEEWVQLAQDAGMQYMVVTSKHHDGFALFQSEYDSYNCVTGSPFGRDIIEEIATACQKHGMKLGLYYSQELDWHEPDGGGYNAGHTNCDCMSWTNDWDFPDNAGKDYARLFEGKIKTQVREILTNYGDLALIWFDTPNDITDAQSMELYQMVKKYQPNCLINSRLGNGAYDYVSLGDNEIPDHMPENEEFDPAKMNDCDGFKPSPYGLYETAATMNHSWGYCAWDQNWKSAEQILDNKRRLNGMGINYLLNVGPDHLGRIPGPSQKILREVAKHL